MVKNTAKDLQYLQIKENTVSENAHIVAAQHFGGKINPADIFIKEDMDAKHFIKVRNAVVEDPSPSTTNSHCLSTGNSVRVFHRRSET